MWERSGGVGAGGRSQEAAFVLERWLSYLEKGSLIESLLDITMTGHWVLVKEETKQFNSIPFQ